jgi:hypothetical protein
MPMTNAWVASKLRRTMGQSGYQVKVFPQWLIDLKRTQLKLRKALNESKKFQRHS